MNDELATFLGEIKNELMRSLSSTGLRCSDQVQRFASSCKGDVEPERSCVSKVDVVTTEHNNMLGR